MSSQRVTISAHAKLNLALSVGPPRPPKGYHPIASWFVPIDLHDTLVLERAEPDAPSAFLIQWAADAPRPTPIDWPLTTDLVVRACKLLERRAGRALPVDSTLHKRIPAGGGLGGGSSDAAAALVGINDLFGLGLSRADLRAASSELGSDVAFFIDEGTTPRPAIVTGFGEAIERLDNALSADILLMFPPFGCPTGAVYKAFDRSPGMGLDEQHVRRIASEASRSGAIDPVGLFNDLAAPACAVEPRLREAWDALQHACGSDARVHLTGSGSTLFAMVSRDSAPTIAQRCRSARPDVAVVPTRLIAPQGA